MRIGVGLLMVLGLSLPASADVVVPIRTIAVGESLHARDLALAPGTAPHALQSIAQSKGYRALVPLYANRPIKMNDLGPITILKRNQETTAKYLLNGLEITAVVRSLGEAAVGETVRAMNLASRQIFVGIVTADGAIVVQRQVN